MNFTPCTSAFHIAWWFLLNSIISDSLIYVPNVIYHQGIRRGAIIIDGSSAVLSDLC